MFEWYHAGFDDVLESITRENDYIDGNIGPSYKRWRCESNENNHFEYINFTLKLLDAIK